jgi:hypothetical protein
MLPVKFGVFVKVVEWRGLMGIMGSDGIVEQHKDSFEYLEY